MGSETDKTKVLLVAEDNDIRLQYEQALQEEGYAVLLASSAEEVRQKIEEAIPGVVVLEAGMSGTDSIQLLQDTKVKYQEIPFILRTANGSSKQDFRIWSSDAYVVKSADLSELKLMIREVLGFQLPDSASHR